MKKEVLIGTVIGLACAGFVLLLPLEMRKDFLLALGALIPAIYVGFSIQGGNVKEIVIQVLGALFFVFLSLLRCAPYVGRPSPGLLDRQLA